MVFETSAQQWPCMTASVLLVALGQALLHRDWDGTAMAVYGLSSSLGLRPDSAVGSKSQTVSYQRSPLPLTKPLLLKTP